jgi:hypothetical protein
VHDLGAQVDQSAGQPIDIEESPARLDRGSKATGTPRKVPSRGKRSMAW